MRFLIRFVYFALICVNGARSLTAVVAVASGTKTRVVACSDGLPTITSAATIPAIITNIPNIADLILPSLRQTEWDGGRNHSRRRLN
jgi:hypothetical protein